MTQSIPIRRLCQCIIMAGLFIFVGIIVPNSFIAEAQNESTVTPSPGTSSPAPTTEPPSSSASPTLAGGDTLELTNTPMQSTTQPINPTQTTESAPSTTATSPLATDTTITETPLTMTPLPTTRIPSATTETSTASVTAPTPSPTPSLTPSQPVTPPPRQSTTYPSRAIMINEIAWAGTHASSSDEWIELYNNSAAIISLTGWTLTDDGDMNINLAGDIAPYSYFLLERTIKQFLISTQI